MVPVQDGESVRSPVFFLSYARGPAFRTARTGLARDNSPVVRLFDDLCDHVNVLVGSPVGLQPGFMDRTMEGGARWTEKLLEAAGTCQVFVPLVSVNYTLSPWCAREWHAFAGRKVSPTGRNQAILPVFWSPMERAQIPPIIGDVQFFAPQERARPDIEDRYYEEGVYGLIAMKDEAYGTVAWRLARHIVDIYNSYRVEPGIVTDHDQLPSSFWADR